MYLTGDGPIFHPVSRRGTQLPRYAFTFDLDTTAMKDAGYTQSQINNNMYGEGEIKTAFGECGFTEHPEGSVYHTAAIHEEESLIILLKIRETLKLKVPTFCRYVKSIHLFKMEGYSNITDLIKSTDGTAAGFMQPLGNARQNEQDAGPETGAGPTLKQTG